MPSARKLKVGLVFDDTLDSSDGVAQYVKTLGRWLSGQGHEVRYLVGESKTTDWAGGKVYSLAKNIKVRFNGNVLTIPALASRRNIRKILVQENFDMLHVMVPYSPVMAAKVIKSASPETAIVGTFHIYPSGILSEAGSRLLRLWLRPSLRRFDQMLSASTAAQSFARSGYRLTSTMVPNTIDVATFKNEQENKKNTVVFLGRLVERKGARELLKAFVQVKQDLPETKLIIGGKGPLRESLEKFVRDNNLSDVEFAGFVPEADKPAFYAQAEVACLPSLGGECFGIVLIEAMAAGSGVVLGGDNPGYRSVLGEHEELLIDPKDTRQFSDRLKLLLTDQKLAAELHDWQERSIKQYDVNVVGKKIESIYSSLIANKNKNEHN